MAGYERAIRTFRLEETDCVPTWGGWTVSAGFFESVTGKRFRGDPRGTFEAYRNLEAMLFGTLLLAATATTCTRPLGRAVGSRFWASGSRCARDEH